MRFAVKTLAPIRSQITSRVPLPLWPLVTVAIEEVVAGGAVAATDWVAAAPSGFVGI
jgi:hypothetical protein